MMGASSGEDKEGVGRLRAMTRMLSAVIVTLLLGVAASAGDEAAAPTKLVYRLTTEAGREPSGDEGRTVVDVLARRFRAAGIEGIEITRSKTVGELTVAVPAALAPKLDAIRGLIERAGTLEFRICATHEETRIQRVLRTRTDSLRPRELLEYLWVPASDGAPDVLVLTPERVARAALEEFIAKQTVPDPAATARARKRYEDVVRDEVFTGDQLDSVSVRSATWGHVVYFGFKEDRKQPFAEFTARHVGEAVAIIIDGKVHSTPNIRSKLPGEGIIEGGGEGFTEQEAKDIAAVLGSGSIPGRLVRVVAPETK